MSTQRRQTKSRSVPASARRVPARAGTVARSATQPLAPSSSLQIKSILAPVDFSAPSEKALDYAVSFAKQFNAKLTLLYVFEPVATPDFAQSFPLLMENDQARAGLEARLRRLVKTKAIQPGMIEQILVRQGRSFQEITDVAEAIKANLIIISTHGYTGLKHMLLGSTTERVVRQAPCPVLVVRAHERDFLPS